AHQRLQRCSSAHWYRHPASHFPRYPPTASDRRRRRPAKRNTSWPPLATSNTAAPPHHCRTCVSRSPLPGRVLSLTVPPPPRLRTHLAVLPAPLALRPPCHNVSPACILSIIANRDPAFPGGTTTISATSGLASCLHDHPIRLGLLSLAPPCPYQCLLCIFPMVFPSHPLYCTDQHRRLASDNSSPSCMYEPLLVVYRRPSSPSFPPS
ncbi:hypothetical protein B0H13DRAFT_2482654, partial [Mycena leptocephala]